MKRKLTNYIRSSTMSFQATSIFLVLLLCLLIVISVSENIIQPDEISVEQKTFDILVANGLTPVQATGIMGVIRKESEFDPKCGDSYSFGLLRWSFERKDNLFKFAHSIQSDPNDLEIQVFFILKELDPNSMYYQVIYPSGYTGVKWDKVSTPEEAARTFSDLIMRPAFYDEVQGEYASEYYETFAK